MTQAYLVGGSNRVRVYQPEGDPPGGFTPVDATLEDAYLVVIKTGGLPGQRHRERLDRRRRRRRCLMSLAAAPASAFRVPLHPACAGS